MRYFKTASAFVISKKVLAGFTPPHISLPYCDIEIETTFYNIINKNSNKITSHNTEIVWFNRANCKSVIPTNITIPNVQSSMRDLDAVIKNGYCIYPELLFNALSSKYESGFDESLAMLIPHCIDSSNEQTIYNLSRSYRFGRGINKNLKQSELFLRKLPPKDNYLIELFDVLNTIDNPKNYNEMYTMMKNLLIRTNTTAAKYRMGLLYFKGKGVMKDLYAAYYYTADSLSDNHPWRFYLLLDIVLELGIKTDKIKTLLASCNMDDVQISKRIALLKKKYPEEMKNSDNWTHLRLT